MNQKQVIANMKSVLDWNAREYGKYEDAEVKEKITKEFRIEVIAFNTLLKSMYVSIAYEKMFPKKIETYITTRECENWE